MSAHTKEPWHVGSQNDALYITAGKPPSKSNDYPDHDADRELIAKVFGSHPVSDANARLIAAAPDLLAALDRLEVSANTVAYCYDKRLDNFASALMQLTDDAKAARAAIAKVKS